MACACSNSVMHTALLAFTVSVVRKSHEGNMAVSGECRDACNLSCVPLYKQKVIDLRFLKQPL